MVSSHCRRKLRREFRREPACVIALMAKCVAGLLIIAGVALFGAETNLNGDGGANRLQVQHHHRPSLAQTKRLYDERRARFASRQGVVK